MKKHLLLLCLVISSSIFAQNFWSTTTLNQSKLKNSQEVVSDQNLYAIDLNALTAHLAGVPERVNYAIQSNYTLEIPNQKGEFEKYYIAEASNFAPGLQAQYPNIRSYRGVNVNNPAISIAFSVSPRGVQVMRLEAGNSTTFVEPITTDNSVYLVKTKTSKSEDWTCSTPDEELEDALTNRFNDNPENLDADDQTMRDFRLALSCTGEYAQYFGGTVDGALAGMNATMTRVNGLLEKEVAIHLTMIDNNADVVFTSASSDPYSPASNIGAWNSELQSTLTEIIGENNYDIGHLFGASGGGGNAGCIGCVCNVGKGSAYTSPYNGIPEGDRFDVDYVIHEMGHQLGANHTFSRYEGSGVNYEPGSGSTIMGYAGITGGSTDVQDYSDDYFHTASIQQITANVKNKTCPTLTAISNQTPTADAGADYVIPMGTPFILTGSGSDADGDVLTYSWEQVDSSNSSFGDFSTANPNLTVGPLVRSLYPSTSPIRYIPSFDKVKANNLNSPFESVSNVSRSMNFALQVRDNNPGAGQTMSDRMRVNVTANGGAFKVTSPNGQTSVLGGDDLEVTWDVAQTNQSPVNTSMVDILLSIDNGENFSVIASNVDNDGSYAVTIPDGMVSEGAYIIVKAVDNIFYALSEKFYIGYTAEVVCHEYTATGLPLDIPDRTGSAPFGNYAVGQFAVSHTGTVDEIRVSVDITHPYINNLQVVLNSPSPSNLVKLWNRQCTNQDNLNMTFAQDGSPVNCSQSANGNTVMPNESLSSFEGFQTQGTWLIGARDGAAQNVGTFNSATITFCSTEYTLGTNETSHDKMMVNVYPNPSNGLFHVKMDLASEGVALAVYDLTGKQIYTFSDKNASGSFEHELNLASFAKGLYILQIQTGNELVSKKLIVK